MICYDDEWDEVSGGRAANLRAALESWRALLPPLTRGGEYRNRAGELVTWQASEDGSRVEVHTWPDDVEAVPDRTPEATAEQIERRDSGFKPWQDYDGNGRPLRRLR